MFKLPRIFSHFDKELHFLFYFCAAFIVNYLIDKNTIGKHIIIQNINWYRPNEYIMFIFGFTNLIFYMCEYDHIVNFKKNCGV